MEEEASVITPAEAPALYCISFDMGIRNLACASLRVSHDAYEILDWRLMDVAEMAGQGDTDLGEQKIEEAVDMFSATLAPHIGAWLAVFPQPPVCFIESQPIGLSANNIKAKVLSHVLQTMFSSRGIKVKFVSPALKLRGMAKAEADPGLTKEQAQKKSYTANKRFAMERVEALLQGPWADWYAARKGKKDDLCDALLQGIDAGREMLKPAPKTRAVKSSEPKPKKPRAATVAQKAADSAEADLKELTFRGLREVVDEGRSLSSTLGDDKTQVWEHAWTSASKKRQR